MSAAESTGASLDSLSSGDLPSVWTHLMVFVVGMRTAAVMESGSHVCLDILVSDRPVVLNYQSDCLSTVFAWILISPNSVLTPSGECVGDGERKCVCVCVCVYDWMCACACASTYKPWRLPRVINIYAGLTDHLRDPGLVRLPPCPPGELKAQD